MRSIRTQVVDHDQAYAICAVIILIIPGTILLGYISPWISWKLGPAMAVGALFVAVLLSLLVATIVLQFLRYNRRSRVPFRVERLRSISQCDDFAKLLPHRWVEFLCHKFRRGSLGINGEMCALAPGEVITVNLANYEAGTSPWQFLASDLSFEPTPWKAFDSRMRELLSVATENQSRAWDRQDEREKERMIGAHRPWIPWSAFVGLPVILSSLAIGATSTASVGSISVVGLLVLLMIIVVRFLVVGSAYYLVPGGLVRIKHGLLYRKPQLHLLTPGNAALVLYVEGGCHIITREHSERVRTDTNMNRALLLAWTSSARTPTMQELRTLLVGERLASKTTAVDAR